MKLIVNSNQMKQIDSHTIEKVGIPGIVLMERAALAVCQVVMQMVSDTEPVLIVCGTGNNGADGIAVARLLTLKGYKVDIFIAGDIEKSTSLFLQQYTIAKNLGISINNKLEADEYTIIVDAIFGVGLNRTLDQYYVDLIDSINAAGKKIVSVDIPSGLSADTGRAMGGVIKAFITVTFGFLKMGQILYPGCDFSGKVELADIGFPEISLKSGGVSGYIYEPEDLSKLPERKNDSNKGTYGKVLVIAGSKDIYGACYFSAKAAYKTGAGLVKVVTPTCNRSTLGNNLPESLIYTYDTEQLEKQVFKDLKDMLEWASVVVMGPGMGVYSIARELFEFVINNINKPLILDADAIQILCTIVDEELIEKELNINNSKNIRICEQVNEKVSKRIECCNLILPKNTILTPHMKELSDLLKVSVKELKENVLSIADICTDGSDLIYVMKDARTIVAHNKNRYINLSGNNGMATAGSGDVLTGIIAGLIAQGLTPAIASELGVYIHGLTGDAGKEKYGAYALLASDMIDMLPVVLKENSSSTNILE
ncbi:MAG: NAD(P)H-hydrate dehydratase [Anaerocolumna sp.]